MLSSFEIVFMWALFGRETVVGSQSEYFNLYGGQQLGGRDPADAISQIGFTQLDVRLKEVTK